MKRPGPRVDEFFRDLQEHANRSLFPKLGQSRFSMAVIDGEPDVKLCLEVGASLLLDKPLILVVKRNSFLIPLKLRNLAEAIIEYDALRRGCVRRQVQEATRRLPCSRPECSDPMGLDGDLRWAGYATLRMGGIKPVWSLPTCSGGNGGWLSSQICGRSA